jgi:hypothetical protein
LSGILAEQIQKANYCGREGLQNASAQFRLQVQELPELMGEQFFQTREGCQGGRWQAFP